MPTPLLDPAAEQALSRAFCRAMQRAGDALAVMSGHSVTVASQEVRGCSASSVVEMAGGPEAVVVAVYQGIHGAMSGHALLMLRPEGARRLAGLLLAGLGHAIVPHAALEFDPLELSALSEVGNVTISAFLNEIGRYVPEPVAPTPPQTVVEMAGAILDEVLLDLVADSDQVLAARTEFREGDVQVDGIFLVLPRPEPLVALINALGAERTARVN